MKAIARPGTAVPRALCALQQRHLVLRRNRRQVEHGVVVVELGQHFVARNRARRVERHQHRVGKRQGLQAVEPVVQAHTRRFLLAAGSTLVVPGRPGTAPARHHAIVGMQHGAVGLVADGAQHLAFLRRRLGQQLQRLIAVHGQHHSVKALAVALGMHLHASGIAHDALHRHAQTRIQAAQQFVHVLARTTGHGEPLRTVAHLNEAVVVAKTDHGGHRKAQHLVGRAAPDAAQHGQEIPVAKGRAKAVPQQKIAQGLVQRSLFTRLCQGGTQLVKAQQLAQHAPKARAQQVAPLGKHRGQVRATPLQRPRTQHTRARHLHRKRHIRMGAGNLQLIE